MSIKKIILSFNIIWTNAILQIWRVVFQNKQQQDCCVQIRGEEQGRKIREGLLQNTDKKIEDDLHTALNESLTSVFKMDQGGINNGNEDMRWWQLRQKQNSRNLIYAGWRTQKWKKGRRNYIK